MAQAPYPVMNMKDGSTKMSDGTITMPDGTNFNPILPSNGKLGVDSSGQTPANAQSKTDGVSSMAGRKNIPKSSVNPTTGFDYLKSSFPTSTAPVPQYIQTGAGTTSVQSGPLPISQVKPTLVQAPKTQTEAVSSNKKKNVQSLSSMAQSSIRLGKEKATTTPPASILTAPTISTTPVLDISTPNTHKNIPSSTPIIDTLGAISGTATTSVKNTTQTPEQVASEKEARLIALNKADLAQKNLELEKGTNILQTNNKVLMRLYGIDDKGNIDTTNPNGLASQIEKTKLDYENKKNALLGEYSSARLRNVQSQIRKMLTSRGIDITKIPQEQLIQLSGEIGNTAFNDIYSAKEKTVTDILTNGAAAEDKINALREKGVISQNDLRVATETLRSKVLGDINTINKQFANDIFGIKDSTRAEIQSRKTAAINAITQFGTQLGLTGNRLGAITSYMNNFSNPTDALTAMMQDLSNPSSAIYKTVGAVTAEQLRAAANKMTLEQQKADAATLSAQARVASANKAATNESKFSASQQAGLANLGYPGVTTPSQLTAIYSQATPAQKLNIDKAINQAGVQYQ